MSKGLASTLEERAALKAEMEQVYAESSSLPSEEFADLLRTKLRSVGLDELDIADAAMRILELMGPEMDVRFDEGNSLYAIMELINAVAVTAYEAGTLEPRDYE